MPVAKKRIIEVGLGIERLDLAILSLLQSGIVDGSLVPLRAATWLSTARLRAVEPALAIDKRLWL